MRARGRGMTWWARTAQKSGSRLLPNAAVPVWLSSALRVALAQVRGFFFWVPCLHHGYRKNRQTILNLSEHGL